MTERAAHPVTPSAPTTTAPALTRALGFPPSAALFPLPVGAFATALVLDIGAWATSAPCSGYTYPSFLLHVIGLVSGIATVTAALPDLAHLRSDPVAFRTGVRLLLTWDAALVCLGVSTYLRHDRDTCADVSAVPLTLTVVGVALLVIALVGALRAVFSSAEPTADPDA